MNKRIVFSKMSNELLAAPFVPNNTLMELAISSFFDKLIDVVLEDCIINVTNTIKVEAITRSSIDEVYNDIQIYVNEKYQSHFKVVLEEKYKEKVVNNKKNFRYVYQ